MGHRFNSAKRKNGECSLSTSRWSAYGLVKDLLEHGNPSPPQVTNLPQRRIPRRQRDESSARATHGTAMLKGVTRGEIEQEWGDDRIDKSPDLLATRPDPWCSTGAPDGTWYDEVDAEGARITDEDNGLLMFYTDHHRWSPAETDVVERLISANSPAWTIKYAHGGLSGILSYMGIEDSRLCRYPEGIDWTTPSDTEAALGCQRGHAIWISHISQNQACYDYSYVYRWDGLLGLLTRGPVLVKELRCVPACPVPTLDRTICGAVIDEAKRRITVWPRSIDPRQIVALAWPGWSVDYYPKVDGWTHHASISGRPSIDQRRSWPNIVHNVLAPLNDVWDSKDEVDLDSIAQMQKDWYDDMSAGRMSQRLNEHELRSISEGSHFAYLLARIQYGDL